MSEKVRPGYKQTAVGVIPEEWEVRTISQSFDVTAGGDFDPPSSNSIKDKRHPYPIYSNAVTDSGLYGYCSYSVHPAGSITVTARGTLGVANFRDHQYTAIGRVLVLQQKKELDGRFFSEFINNRINFVIESTGVPQLTAPQIAKYKLPFPPLPEQHAIATALSDADALIGALDRLIAKKCDLKQAAMQQLLTGQTRLPGFSGDWEVKRLGDVGDITSAGVDKKSRPGEVPVRLVNYLDVYRKDFIFSDDLNHWVTAPPNQVKRCTVQKGDVFFTPSSETRDDIGISAVAMEDIPDATYSYHVVRLRLRDEWNLCFRTYAFKTRAFLDQAEMLCDGSGQRYVISQGKFKSMTVKVPPLPEQTAIATVLSDMDAEIAALEARRDKTRALKQGMMQELLTGRTRLL